MGSEDEIHVRRVLLQHLEAWQRAGLTHLSHTPSPKPQMQAQATVAEVVANALSATRSAPLPAAASPSETIPHSVAGDATTLAKRSPSKETAPSPATTGKPLSRQERETQLAIVQKRVAACTRCRELAETRTQTVFGVGNPLARVMFIGEAPGADEDEQGEPFVGRAGQLLNRIIEAAKMKREEIYICNILRCRPPGNRAPEPQEAANCREYLDAQISIVDPEYIVCWGACAAQNLLGVTDAIGKLRRRFFQYGRAKVLCTYHPSYLLRNPAAKKDVWEDIQLLMAELGIPIDKT
jgi:DNA polymerase